MSAKFTGGCACGAIRYECDADPIMMFNCHCRDCQRLGGGPYTAVFYLPAKALKIKGTPRYHNTESAAMGDHKRGFCPECGSRLFGGMTDDGCGVTASSLDDPSLFHPQFDIFTSDAQPWDHMDPTLPKFEKYPPRE